MNGSSHGISRCTECIDGHQVPSAHVWHRKTPSNTLTSPQRSTLLKWDIPPTSKRHVGRPHATIASMPKQRCNGIKVISCRTFAPIYPFSSRAKRARRETFAPM